MPAKKRQPSAEEMLRIGIIKGLRQAARLYGGHSSKEALDLGVCLGCMADQNYRGKIRAAIRVAMKAERAEGGKSRGK